MNLAQPENTTVYNSSEVPGLPEPLRGVHPHEVYHETRQYILHYRQGNNLNWKMFAFKGTFREAMQRSRSHCEKMGYRFLLLRPAFSVLEDDERMRENGITI